MTAANFNPKKGEIVSVPVHTSVGTLEHKGIATGEDTFIHCAKLFNAVIESPYDQYVLTAVGEPWIEGYPGQLNPDDVVMRARSRLGDPWNVTSNCEHFVYWAHAIEVQSPQVQAKVRKGFIAGIIGLVLYTVGRR